MFQALMKTSPSMVLSLYVPGQSSSTMTYGPSHGGESLWWFLLLWMRQNTWSPMLKAQPRTRRLWYRRNACWYLVERRRMMLHTSSSWAPSYAPPCWSLWTRITSRGRSPCIGARRGKNGLGMALRAASRSGSRFPRQASDPPYSRQWP